ncbi:transcription factor of the MADS box [Umbelopsis nana]
MALQENHKSQVMQTYGLTAVQETAQNSSSIIDDDYSDDLPDMPGRRSGRRKIKIEYIDEKSRRHITFSKRKAGIMKKAYELSTLTGTQILLLVVSETGLVYTFTTSKLQPLVTKSEGKSLIQACLNSTDSYNPSPQNPVKPGDSYPGFVDSLAVSERGFTQQQVKKNHHFATARHGHMFPTQQQQLYATNMS